MRYSQKIRPSVVIYAILSVLMCAFIFLQSFLPAQQSGALSMGVSQWVYPLVNRYWNLSQELFHHLIRKAAHFTEFFFLGLSITGFCLSMQKQNFRSYFSHGLFLCLLVSVSDEFLQHFTGRGSAVTDVVIDFSGALCAMLLVYFIRFLVNRKVLRL